MDWRERLKNRMDELGWTASRLTKEAGVNYTMVHDILTRGTNPSVGNLAKLANALGLTLGQLYEGTEGVRSTVLISGMTRGGGMWSEYPDIRRKEIPIQLFSRESITIEVSDASLEPVYSQGDIISRPKMHGDNLSNVVGRDCIVLTETGSRYVCILLRGSNTNLYNLRPFNRRESDVTDQRIAWAAPILLRLQTLF